MPVPLRGNGFYPNSRSVRFQMHCSFVPKGLGHLAPCFSMGCRPPNNQKAPEGNAVKHFRPLFNEVSKTGLVSNVGRDIVGCDKIRKSLLEYPMINTEYPISNRELPKRKSLSHCSTTSSHFPFLDHWIFLVGFGY